MKANKTLTVGEWFSFLYLKNDADKPKRYKILVDVIFVLGRERIFSGRKVTGEIRHFLLDRVVAEDDCTCTVCGEPFSPSYGEYHRCPSCLSKQHANAERDCGVE